MARYPHLRLELVEDSHHVLLGRVPQQRPEELLDETWMLPPPNALLHSAFDPRLPAHLQPLTKLFEHPRT
jgi:hypothetical protein